MASSEEPSPSLASHLSSPSSDTALCMIPPRHLWESIDRLRSLHDKAYNRWPPHVNVVYPFVNSEYLPDAVEAIRQLDFPAPSGQPELKIILDEADSFNHKQYNTIHLRPSHGSETENVLSGWARSVLAALGRPAKEQFNPHMTIAQSYDAHCASHHYLMEKVRALASLTWDVTELAILVRDRGSSRDSLSPAGMRVWAYISINPPQVRRLPKPESLYTSLQEDSGPSIKSTPQTAYHYSTTDDKWVPVSVSETSNVNSPSVNLDRLIVASYNVLGEFEWPPNEERYPNLIAHIVSDRGLADILVLEEATDHFLQYLLADERIRSRYSYSTHGPSNQVEVGPLPNHLNVVVLSRFELQWSHLPFQRKHKGAAIVTFPALKDISANHHEIDGGLPLVLAACHLTHGLVDGAVTCKKNEITRLLDHLSSHYGAHPQIIAGDFNMPTSSYTIDMARKTRHISSESYRYLHNFDSTLSNAGLQDAWLASRIQSGESSASTSGYLQQSSFKHYEGEQGATFDPLANRLAAKLVGNGLNNRPQRYDRILVNGHLTLRPNRFNMFGMERDGDEVGASDHWGVRCLLSAQQPEKADNRSNAYIRSVKLQKLQSSFSTSDHLEGLLYRRELCPREKDVAERQDIIRLLERALECRVAGNAKSGESRGGAQFVLAPVGSFGLDVWTPESDLDLLCLGSISHKTFMKLAVARLRKYSTEGVTILRKVKASTGTMLLLDVNGVSVDLHYCGAARILEQYPNVLNRPSTDPAFSLSIQTLYKLKPLRDVSYLRRSIPDMAQYRTAHLFIKAWAKSRGLYGARFGLLGGIHITALLVPVVKMLANDVGSVSVGDILSTFFHHYSHVDWKTQVVLDPFFHGTSLNHRRLDREPMCLLGWHPPALNTALNASIPTVQTISTEMARARALLSHQNMTWDRFMGPHTADMGAEDFLKSHKSYIRIDVNYWGSSSQKRNGFIGWLESRCVMLLVDLDRKVPKMAARIWPQRFFESHDSTSSESKSDDLLEYHGCYLIGLEWMGAMASEAGDEIEDASMKDLERALALFSDRIRENEMYYDASTSWMGASVAHRSGLKNLKPDHRQVGDNTGEAGFDDDFDSDDEEEEEDEIDTETQGDREVTLRSKVDPRHGPTVLPSKTSAGKLRTSTDVMNRIRWDPSLDSSDYIVGYDDRFTGIQEKKFDEWKSDLTDEEFIPQHRVMFFKRRSDGEIVWDRKMRVDKIFGHEGSE